MDRPNSNGKELPVGLWLEGDIAFYQTRYMTTPIMFDARFAKDCDRVGINRVKHFKNVHGLRIGQEFIRTWKMSVIVFHDGVGKNVKRMLMEERGIPEHLINRISTKYKDGNMYNVTSENVLLAEVVCVSDHTSKGYDKDNVRFFRTSSSILGKEVKFHKEDMLSFFNSHYKDVKHPLVLAYNGKVVTTKNC